MKFNGWMSRILKARDSFISMIQSFFFILIILTLFGLCYIIGLDTHNIDYGKIEQEGIKYVFENYKISFNFGAAFLAILAIYLTMRRMNQSQTQIEIMGANNQFNNFYRHRDEFVNYSGKKGFIINLAKYSNQNQEDLLIKYHGMYFGTNYKIFNTSITIESMKQIQKCFKLLRLNAVLPNNFNEYVKTGKPVISIDWSLEHKTDTDKAITNLYNAYSVKFKKLENLKMVELRMLCNIYYDCKIKSLILAFSGEGYKDLLPIEFIEKCESFLNETGLYILNFENNL